MYSSNMKTLLQAMIFPEGSAYDKTWTHHNEDSRYWFAPHSMMTHLIISVYSEYGPEKSTNQSMVFIRLLEIQRSIIWSCHTVYSGAYESALRDLRLVIEDSLQAIYLDRTMGDVDVTAKVRALQILDDRRFRGSELIKRCMVSSKVRNELQAIYRELSGYVHPSHEFVKRSFIESDFDGYGFFKYNRDSFEHALQIHSRVYDILFSLFLSNYPDAIPFFFDDEDIRRNVVELEYSFTLQMMTDDELSRNE